MLRNFFGYLEVIEGRLVRMNSPFRVELQPAAVPGRGRVYSFVDRPDLGFLNEILYPESRRVDAGIVNITSETSVDGLYPLVSGFDITLNPLKPDIVPYYQEAFGPIPILTSDCLDDERRILAYRFNIERGGGDRDHSQFGETRR